MGGVLVEEGGGGGGVASRRVNSSVVVRVAAAGVTPVLRSSCRRQFDGSGRLTMDEVDVGWGVGYRSNPELTRAETPHRGHRLT